MATKIGPHTFALSRPVTLADGASTVGKKEGEGPLAAYFEEIEPDLYFGQKTWEQAESELVRRTVTRLLQRCGGAEAIFGGDLTSQCTATSYGLRGVPLPVLGLYAACATMSEALTLAALALDGGGLRRAICVTSSHFAGAERQFRMPLEYGSQRTPTAQWTVTGCGAALLTAEAGWPRVTRLTPGLIRDAGITDPADMGAAMAPAALETIAAHLAATGTRPTDYDLILTGDLGHRGSALLEELAAAEGLPLAGRHGDCGMLMFDRERQDVHAGGSGAGCSASILCGHILPELRRGRWRRVLFCATGALLSPTVALQAASIPAICHAVELVGQEG